MATSHAKQAAPYPGLLRLLNGVESTLAAVEKRIAALSMLAILLGISVSIVARVAKLPFPSTGELAIVAMAPLAFVGGAFCSYMHRHINIDAAEVFGPPPVQRIIRLLASAVMAVFAGTYCWLAISLLQYVWSSGERLIDLGTPVWIPVSFIVLGSFLMFVHSAMDIVRLALGLPRTEEIR